MSVTPAQPYPQPPATAVAVASRPLRALAVQFDGSNAAELQQLCAESAREHGYDTIPDGGIDMILDQPYAQIFDARAEAWRMVPLGAWVVVVEGRGALVLDASWFPVLFGDADVAQAADLHAAMALAGQLSRTVGDLRQIMEHVDAQTLAARRPDVYENLYAEGPGAASPWSAQRLRPVPEPGSHRAA